MNEKIKELQGRRKYAAILMNYSCTIKCDHCCFNCSPQKPDAVVSVEDGVRYLGELHKTGREVHIAGGEPFRYYERLRDIVYAANAKGVAPHFIESNASWCTSDDITRERLTELKEGGVMWMFFSTDPYHLKYIPVERLIRAITIAEELFGADTTMGKVDFGELRRVAEVWKDEEKATQYIRGNPPMLVGRAARKLAKYVEPVPLSEMQLEIGWGLDPNNSCNSGRWDPLWEVHADPYGNLQTNCGIILGNVDEVSISELIQTWHLRNPILKGISERSVAFLLDMARDYGFVPEEKYPQRCYLCQKIRTFLREADDKFKEVFGPDEVYED